MFASKKASYIKITLSHKFFHNFLSISDGFSASHCLSLKALLEYSRCSLKKSLLFSLYSRTNMQGFCFVLFFYT